MIKPGPDMVASGENDSNSGWNADGDIRGFSQTHVSGTGGGAKYGNILVQPTTGDPSHSAHSRRAQTSRLRRGSTRSDSPASASASKSPLPAAPLFIDFAIPRPLAPISFLMWATA